MTRILVANPNSTAAMTDRMVAQISHQLPNTVSVTGVTNADGPPAIQGLSDGIRSVHGTMSLLRSAECDLAILGCFDDTGMSEIRDAIDTPLIGLGESSFQQANASEGSWGVLTTMSVSVPVITSKIKRLNLGGRCEGVFASDIPVLAFEHERDRSYQSLIESAEAILKRSPHISCLILGCAGMGGLAEEFGDSLGIKVIDPVDAAAAKAMEILGEPNKVTHSRAG